MAVDANKLKCHIFDRVVEDIFAEMYGVSCPKKTLSIPRAINYDFIYTHRVECEVVDALVCTIENSIKKLPTVEGCILDNLNCDVTVTVVDPEPTCGGTITVIRIS